MQNPAKLTLLSVTGDDAQSFLQGQLTQDVTQWADARSVRLAGWCTVKGRLWVSCYIWQTPLGYDLLLPQDMAEKTLKRLKMYVLRAKVSLSLSEASIYFGELNHPAMTISDFGTVSLLSLDGKHYGIGLQSPLAGVLDWDTAHIRAGVAWISAANSEAFVPQSVNYELVGGVSFKKGCYPGQEVVARSQYLGKLRKRAAIARLENGDLSALNDVCVVGEADPVGSVVLAAPGWVLIECAHALVQDSACLTVDGHPLTLQPLPYSIHDITQ